jgi:hypothetical protein
MCRCFWCLEEAEYEFEQQITKKVRCACRNHKFTLMFWVYLPIVENKTDFR